MLIKFIYILYTIICQFVKVKLKQVKDVKLNVPVKNIEIQKYGNKYKKLLHSLIDLY